MNFKLTIGLVVALLVLVAVYFMLPEKKPVEKDPSGSTPVFSPKPAGVKAIALTREGKQELGFSRGEKGWELTFPIQARAEGYRVEGIADGLMGVSYKKKFEVEATGDKSAAATGTDKPRYVVTFTDDAGTQHTLGLGKRTVGGMYATVDRGKTVYLLASDPMEGLDEPAEKFRDKEIQRIATDKLTAVTVTQQGQQGVTLTKNGEAWTISKPVNARADSAKVSAMIGELGIIRASGFSEMAKESAATGLNPPVLTVTAVVGGAGPTTGPAAATGPAGQTVTLELGFYTGLIEKKSVYASIAGTKEVFTINAQMFDKFNRELKDLRDAAITPAAVADATEATITTVGKPAVKIVKRDGVWDLTSTKTPVRAGELQVGDWLGDVRNFRAINFVDSAGDLKAIGLDPPVSKIELTIPGQSQREVILIGKPEAKDPVTPMMRQGEPTVYLVQNVDAGKAVPTELDLRDRAIEKFEATRIRGVTISGPAATGGGLELTLEGHAWNVKSGGKTAKADEEKMTELLASFTPLTASMYVSETVDRGGAADVVVTLQAVEPVVQVTATKPATKPATTGPATKPAGTMPAGLEGEVAGPPEMKAVSRTLKLFKVTEGTDVKWRAVWDGAEPQWTFVPMAGLVELVTKEKFAVVGAATQGAGSQPATRKAE